MERRVLGDNPNFFTAKKIKKNWTAVEDKWKEFIAAEEEAEEEEKTRFGALVTICLYCLFFQRTKSLTSQNVGTIEEDLPPFDS